ncbi:MAG: AAA family ATPase, partial [Deltaproteobacteria bacterium]|nr:AAA family ATPase [Deltaproteobacteria bacterium]
MKAFPVSRACDLALVPDEQKWLIEELWAQQAVGILGGEPKCCKSFLALDMAVSVASGTPCLRQFSVCRTGPVLLFPAEDSLSVVRERLEGICRAAGTTIEELPLYVITAPRLLLDVPQDRQRLRSTLEAIRPALLVLDPFIRLHRADENASKEMAPLLGYLRELQREFKTAVLLVHHARKGSGKDRPGQALRGSSDLHGWGDSNLYLRRKPQGLSLSIEQRAAPSRSPVPLELAATQDALALTVVDAPVEAETRLTSARERVIEALTLSDQPLSTQQLRKRCRIRTATLCATLAELGRQDLVTHGSQGYAIAPDPA